MPSNVKNVQTEKAGIFSNKKYESYKCWTCAELCEAFTFLMEKGAAVAEWLSSWLAEQEDRGSIPGLAT